MRGEFPAFAAKAIQQIEQPTFNIPRPEEAAHRLVTIFPGFFDHGSPSLDLTSGSLALADPLKLMPCPVVAATRADMSSITEGGGGVKRMAFCPP